MRIIAGQGRDLIAVGGADEAFVAPIFGTLARTLDELDKGAGASMAGVVGRFRGCISRPATRELIVGNRLPTSAMSRLIRHGDEHVEATTLLNIVQKLNGKVLGIDQNERGSGRRRENLRGQIDQLGRRIDDTPRSGGGGEADGLTSIASSTQKV